MKETTLTVTARLVRATVRQAVVGLAVALASLPLLLVLSRTLGLTPPPVDGLLLLGGAVVLAFAGGGLLGALLTVAVLRGFRGRIRGLAALAGLAWGIALCSIALPLYTENVFDELTDTGTEAAMTHAGDVLNRPSAAADQALDIAGHLAAEGAARLPAVVLLIWVVVGPALVAPLEARPPRASRPRGQ